ncbi:glycosyltransferase family 9 protein [Xanthobacter autotrophicus DSM 597]|uniref:glycosyltransferase family 9 protein n=1 Tax=Xanthobacter wiegelii TaxID=3119913 RepID=UPI00372BFC55
MAWFRDLLGVWRQRPPELSAEPPAVEQAADPAATLPFPAPPAPAPEPTFAPGPWRGPLARLAELGPAPSLLVVKLDHVGDFVTALPAVRRLREAFPASRVTLLCAPFVRDFAAATGLFDAVRAFDYYPARGHPPAAVPPEALAALAVLDLPPADIAIDLRHADDARPLLAALPVRFRVGFAGLHAGHGLDLALPEMEASARTGGLFAPLPAGVRLSALAEVLVSAFRAGQSHPPAPITLGALPALPDVPDGYGVLAPGARLAIKLWPVEYWRALAARMLAESPLGLVLTGTAEDAPLCAAIAEGLPADRVANLAGRQDLAGLAAVIGGARVVVALDSAPAHLAAALGRPTLCLFSGLADIHSWAPAGPRVAVVSAHASCAPCFLSDVADCAHGHGCMTRLTPDHALAGLAALGLEFAGVRLH